MPNSVQNTLLRVGYSLLPAHCKSGSLCWRQKEDAAAPSAASSQLITDERRPVRRRRCPKSRKPTSLSTSNTVRTRRGSMPCGRQAASCRHRCQMGIRAASAVQRSILLGPSNTSWRWPPRRGSANALALSFSASPASWRAASSRRPARGDTLRRWRD